jgi:hypothetical protein
VSFITGATGVLELSDWTAFTGTVGGLSTTGTNSIDLAGFTLTGAKASYSGTTAAGVLTVSNGTQTAKIHLIGDYLGSSFTLAGDGHGGTTVKDPPAALVQALATFPASPAAPASARPQAVADPLPTLLGYRIHTSL